VNPHVTISTASILRVLIVSWTSRFVGTDTMINAVTRQTQLIDGAKLQKPGIRRTMRRVTGNTSFCLEWRVFVGKRALLISVTFDAGRIGAGG